MSQAKLTDEYKAVRERAGLIDISNRGRIEVKGKNSVQFLQGLVSNDVKALVPGQGVFSAFLNVTGRILADSFIYKIGEGFLIDVAPANGEKIYQSLAKFVPAGDFFVTDVTDETALLTLQGAQADDVLARAGVSAPPQAALQLIETTVAGHPVTLINNSRTGETGYDLVMAREHASAVRDALTQAGASLVGLDALNLLRLEAGLPEYGIDMDENIILLEAGLERAVSYTKGCYLGQETIAKIHHRGHNQTAKRLAGIVIDSATVPAAGAKVFNKDEREIGHITSSAHSPALDKPIALAYLRRDNFTPGQEHSIEHEGARVKATVVELPFYKRADK